MGLLIVGVFLVLFVAVIMYVREKPENETPTTPVIKSTVPNFEPPKASIDNKPIRKPMNTQESLDAIYARTNALWICTHCETINGKEDYCRACGAKR